ncbi:MAG: SusC/RagA family TonB-linked outer membrane protein [Prevotellaceae bacterium]|jgi:TonB-linked SusC/RagA family outer membrane protein|nr:SusC/RagA family TonB-linked outer membrane protein [Prevotellaceae bacterium]
MNKIYKYWTVLNTLFLFGFSPLLAQSVISSDIIERNSISSIEQAMNGTLSGLYSIKSGGEKFGKSNFNFYVRGIATTASSNPLILVDGMEVNIDLIDYNEIESITVLKDASALAMYGMRGANGVILITTKRGKGDDYTFNLSVRTGIQQPERIGTRLNACQYTTLYNEALNNDGQNSIFNPGVYLSEGRDAYLYPDEDFQEQFLRLSTPFQHYNFSSSGGSRLAKYFVTAGYLKQESLFKNTAVNNDYERYNFRINLDINLTENLYFNILTSAVVAQQGFPYAGDGEFDNNAANTNNWIFNTLMTLPANAFPLFNKNNTLGGTSEYKNNPYGMLNKRGYRSDESRLFNALIKGNYNLNKITDGLSLDFSYGFESFNNQFTRVSHSYAVFEEMPDGTYTQYGTDDAKDSRTSALISDFYKYSMLNFGMQYRRSFNKHDLSAQLLYNHSVETATGDNPDYNYQGLSLRAHYGYQKRYYAELTAAYQGSNNFIRGKRSGLFPALGLAWIASEEDWFNSNDNLDLLKIRASYGLTGNDQTGGRRFPYRQTYTLESGYTFGVPGGWFQGTQKGVLPNENETWEKSYKGNFGIDMKLFGAFSVSADYFYENRTGILVDYSNITPSLIGSGLSKYNAGIIRNQGTELSLTYNKTIDKLNFWIGGNIMWAKNKIIDLKEIAYQYPHQYRKGHSTNTLFGYETNGFYLSDEQVTGAPTGQFGTPELGDLVYVNQNAGDDNIIDTRDQVALGNIFPEIVYGAALGAEYKGFDFYCNVEGSGSYYTHFIPSKLSTYSYANRWNPDNPSVQTNYPRLSISSDYNQQTSDFWMQKTYLLSISSAEFGYTLPESLVKKVKLSSVRAYLNVNNPYNFTNVKDNRNPEATGAGYTEMPLLRTYIIGLSINL